MRQIFLISLFTILCISSLTYATVEQLVILGGGPAGLTAAIFAGQGQCNPLVIEGELANGQYASVYKIENFPGFPEGISGLELNEKLRQQAKIFGSHFVSADAVSIDLMVRPFHVTLSNGSEIEAQSLIVATGASPRWLGLEFEQALIGKGISANALVDGPQFLGKEVVVIGGADAAVEQALIMSNYASKVTLVYRGRALNASQYLQDRLFANSKIEIILNSEATALLHKDRQQVTGIVFFDAINKSSFEVACDGIFVATGRKPNTSLFQRQLALTDTGYVVTPLNGTATSIEGVFVAGDIAQYAYRKMVTSAASGCMAALDVIRYLKEIK